MYKLRLTKISPDRRQVEGKWKYSGLSQRFYLEALAFL
ncbi:hypothetical protein DB29_00240 [Shouchella clausii]|nr:hypothetical protein DB29_00240 [Shouchella clausii]